MKHRYYLPLLVVGLLVGLQGKAQQRVSPGYFQEDAAARLAAQTSPLRALLTAARPLTLAAPALRTALAGPAAVLVLPLPCYAVTNMTLGTIATTSAVVNFSRNLELPVSYTLTTVPATTTYANFLPGGTGTGLTPNTL